MIIENFYVGDTLVRVHDDFLPQTEEQQKRREIKINAVIKRIILKNNKYK